MELRLSFASMNDIIDALDKLKTEAVRGNEPELMMPVEVGGRVSEDIRVTFVDEASDEFAEPSATVGRD